MIHISLSEVESGDLSKQFQLDPDGSRCEELSVRLCCNHKPAQPELAWCCVNNCILVRVLHGNGFAVGTYGCVVVC